MRARAKTSGLLVVAALSVLAAPGAARADCNGDIAALMGKRMAEIEALNKNSKAHGGKLDPTEGCPRLRNLAADEAEVVSYMEKNKAWCSLPDEFVQRFTETHAKTASYATKACTFAVKMKQMQEQAQKQAATQQQEQAVKLPTGPL